MKEKVLLDTDIGSDIDDAVCLAYLLANPQCDLLGVTTVTGDVVKRAQMVSALCKMAGKEVPIFPGASETFLVPQRQPHVPQAAALEKFAHQESFPMGHAIGFLRDTIRKYPGEVTLLSIGPLTNLGLLFTLDPEIPVLLKQLVMMVGVFSTRFPGSNYLEWNALIDPHATAMVYRHPVKVHRSIGLDVTRQVVMDRGEVRRRFQAGLLKGVLEFAEVWFMQRPVITFHDPLAAATIFDDQICSFERGQVDVELTSARLAGMTLFTPKPEDGAHEVALGVNPERFFEHYFGMFG